MTHQKPSTPLPHTHVHTLSPLPCIYQPPTLIGCVSLCVCLSVAFSFFSRSLWVLRRWHCFYLPSSSCTSSPLFFLSIHPSHLHLHPPLLLFTHKPFSWQGTPNESKFSVFVLVPFRQHQVPHLALNAKVPTDRHSKLFPQSWCYYWQQVINTIKWLVVFFECSLICVSRFPGASPPTATRKLLHLAWKPLSKQITSHSEYTGICLRFCIHESLRACQIWFCLEYIASRTRRDLQASIPEWSNIYKQPNCKCQDPCAVTAFL